MEEEEEEESPGVPNRGNRGFMRPNLNPFRTAPNYLELVGLLFSVVKKGKDRGCLREVI